MARRTVYGDIGAYTYILGIAAIVTEADCYPSLLHILLSDFHYPPGTSPLYVYSSTFATPPGKDELLCAASLIIWALAFAVTLKYCLVVLYADDAGEGGTFALYSLLARYARIEDREPGKAHKELDRHPTMNMAGPNKKVRAFFESSRAFKLSVRLAAIFGVSLLTVHGQA